MTVNADELRIAHMMRLCSTSSVQGARATMVAKINELVGPDPGADRIFALGGQLKQIFNAGGTGRGQSEVARSGRVWEYLVVWYINLVSLGTNVVAAPFARVYVPEAIRDALSITVYGRTTTSEADVVVHSVPGIVASVDTVEQANQLILGNLNATKAAVIQCKTTWNENAQVPMLWDLVYKSLPRTTVENVFVGRNGRSPLAFEGGNVKYAFATVPTSTKPPGNNSVNVARVRSLSGGNYWGQPTIDGVAKSLSEFLGTNFASNFGGDVKGSLKLQLESKESLVEKFLTMGF